MEIFTIGNLIVLLVLGSTMFVVRRYDQRHNTVDAVKRFLDNAKKEFDAYVVQKQQDLVEISSNLDSLENTAREALRRIAENKNHIEGEASNLNEVKDLVVQMLAEREAIEETIGQIKSDNSYINKIRDRIEAVAKQTLQVEEASGRLVGDLMARNEKGLEQLKEGFQQTIEAESSRVREVLANETEVALSLKAELEGVVAQKETALIASLKIFNAELERIQGIYTNHLQAIEEGAKSMESEGLRAVKENIDDQFEKVKNLTETLFSQETLRFREQLENQVNEFEGFALKYRDMEEKLGQRLNLLDNNTTRLENDYTQFNRQMHDLSGYMQEQFNVEADLVKTKVSQEAARVSTELEYNSQIQVDAVKELINGQLEQLTLSHSRVAEQVVTLEASFQLKEDELRARAFELEENFNITKNGLEEGFKATKQLLEENFEEASRHWNNNFNAGKSQLEAQLLTFSQGIEAQKQLIAEQFKVYSDNLALSINDEKKEWTKQLVLLKEELANVIALSKNTVSDDIEKMLMVSVGEVKEETEEKIKNLTLEWSRAIEQSKQAEVELSAKEEAFETLLFSKITDLDTYFNQVLDDLKQKQRATSESYDHWDVALKELGHLVTNDVAFSKENVQENLRQKMEELENLYKNEWQTKIEGNALVFEQQLEEMASHIGQNRAILGHEIKEIEALQRQKLDDLSSMVSTLDSRLREEAEDLRKNFSVKRGELEEKILTLSKDYEQKLSSQFVENSAIMADYNQKVENYFEQWQDKAIALKESFDERLAKSNGYIDELALAWENRFNTLNVEFKVRASEVENEANKVTTEWQKQYSGLQELSVDHLYKVDELLNQFQFQLKQKTLTCEEEQSVSQQDYARRMEESFKEWQQEGFSLKNSYNESLKEAMTQSENLSLEWETLIDRLKTEVDSRLQEVDSLAGQLSLQSQERFDEIVQWASAKNNEAKELVAKTEESYKKLENELQLKFERALLVVDTEISQNQVGLTNLFEESKKQVEQAIKDNKDDLDHYYKETKEQLEGRLQGDLVAIESYEDRLQTKQAEQLALLKEQWQREQQVLLEEFNSFKERNKLGLAQIEADIEERQVSLKKLLETNDQQLLEESERNKVAMLAKMEELALVAGNLEKSVESYRLENEELMQQRFKLFKETMESGLTTAWDDFDGFKEQNTSRLQQLQEEATANYGRATKQIEEQQNLLIRRLAELDELIAKHEEVSGQSKEELLTKLDDSLKQLQLEADQKIDLSRVKQEEMSRHWQERFVLLDEQQQKALKEAMNASEALKEEWVSRLQSYNEELFAKINAVDKGIDERLAQVDVRAELVEGAWAERYERYSNDLVRRLETTEGSIEIALGDWTKRLDSLQEDLDGRLGEANRLADEVAGRWRKSFEELQEAMTERVKQTTQQVDGLEAVWQERFSEAQSLIASRLDESKSLSHDIEERWKNEYENLQKQLEERSHQFAKASEDLSLQTEQYENQNKNLIEDSLAKINEEWQAKLLLLKEEIFDQLGQTEQESQTLEHSLRERFKKLNGEVEEWITRADKTALEEANRLEAGWQEKLRLLDASEEQRRAEAEQHIKDMEQFWQTKLTSMNSEIENRLQGLKTEADGSIQQIVEQWESHRKNQQVLLEENITLHHKELNSLVETTTSGWMSKVTDLGNLFTQNLEALELKQEDLKQAKGDIDNKILKLTELSATEIELHRGQMQSKLNEQLTTLSGEMKSDWEGRLGNLKKSFALQLEQNSEAVALLADSHQQLAEEKEAFTANLHKMALEAEELYRKGKEKLAGAFEGFEDNLTTWQLNFTTELRRLEEEAIVRGQKLESQQQHNEEGWQTFSSNLEQKQEQFNLRVIGEQERWFSLANLRQDELFSTLEEQQKELNNHKQAVYDDLQTVKETIIEDRLQLVQENKTELEEVVAHFKELGAGIEAHRAELEELLKSKKGDATLLAGQFSAELNQLIEQQRFVFNQQLKEEELAAEQWQHRLQEEQQERDRSYNQRMVELEELWQSIYSKATHQEQEAIALLNDNIEKAKARATEMKLALDEASATYQHEAKERLAAISFNWQEIEKKVIEQQESSQKRIEERLASFEQDNIQFKAKGNEEIEKAGLLAKELEEDLKSEGAKLKTVLQANFDDLSLLTSDYRSNLSTLQEQWQQSMQDKVQEVEQHWQQISTQISHKESEQQQQIEQLEQFYEAEKVKLRASFEERLQEINHNWAVFNEQLSLKQNDFEQDFAGRVEIAEHRLATLEDRFNLKQEAFEDNFSRRLASSVENLKGIQSEFDQKQSEFDQSITLKMEKANASLMALEQDFKDKRVLMEQALARKLDEAGYSLTQLEEDLQSKRQSFEEVLSQRLDKAGESFIDLESDFQEKQNQFAQSLAGRLEEASKQVDELTAVYGQKHQQFENYFEERLKEAVSGVENLEQELLAKTASLQQLVESGLSDTEERLQAVSNDISRKSEATFSDLEARLQHDKNLFSSHLQTFEENVDEKTFKFNNLFNELESDFMGKKKTLENLISSNQQKLSQSVEEITSQRETLLADLNRFKTEMDQFMSEKDAQIHLLIGEQSADLQEKMSKLVFAQFDEADRRLKGIDEQLSQHEKESEMRLASYRNQFLSDVSNIEELIGQAEFELNRKRSDFEEGRRSLESQMEVYRANITNDLHRSQEELKALINSNITQTGEDLSLEFMGTLESRLNDYEVVMKSKLGRMETFINDVDLLEQSLRGSMGDIQHNILNEMGTFETDIRLRHERELERAATMLNSAQQEISNTIHNAQGSISELKVQVDDLRRKALENVTGQLTEFEEGFLGEINKREEVVATRIREWQTRTEQAMSSFEKEQTHEQEGFLEKFTAEQNEVFRHASERLNMEIVQFNHQIEGSMSTLEHRVKETEIEVDTLRETLAAKMDFFASTTDDQVASQLTLLQQSIDKQMGSINQLVSNKVELLKGQFEAEKEQFLELLKGYHNDIEQWRSQGNEAVKHHEDQFKVRNEELNRLFGEKVAVFDSQFEALQVKANEMIDQVSQSFSKQTQTLLGTQQEEHKHLKSDFEQLNERANNLETSIEKKATLYLEQLASRGDELVGLVEKKGKLTQTQVEEQLQQLKSEAKVLETTLTHLSQTAQQTINQKAEEIANRLEQIERRQQAFEANSPIFKQAEEMRQVLENALVDLAERMAKIEGRREEVVQLESQLSKAFKINESLAEKLSTMAFERAKFDELEGRIGQVMNLSQAVDAKILQISNSTMALQEVQARLRNLEDYEKSLQQKYEQLDKRAMIAETTATGVSKNFDLMQDLESKINYTLADYSQMKGQLEQSQQALAIISEQQPRIDHLLQFFNTADQKLLEITEKADHIDKMRDWMVSAENRFINLQNDLNSSLRTAATVVGKEAKADKPKEVSEGSGNINDVNEMVVKLSLQNWTPEQIAGHLKLSISQVNLILERFRR